MSLTKTPLIEDNVKSYITEYAPSHKRYVTVTKERVIRKGEIFLISVMCFIVGLGAGGIFL